MLFEEYSLSVTQYWKKSSRCVCLFDFLYSYFVLTLLTWNTNLAKFMNENVAPFCTIQFTAIIFCSVDEVLRDSLVSKLDPVILGRTAITHSLESSARKRGQVYSGVPRVGN